MRVLFLSFVIGWGMFCLGTNLLIAEEAPTKPKPPPYGVNPLEAKLSSEMQQALECLSAAGQVEGRRDSFTFFRWAATKPPKLAHLGLWGAKIGNDELALVTALPDLEFVSIYETNVDDRGFQTLAKLPNLKSLAVLPIERYEKQGFGPPQWSYPFMEPRADRPRISGEALRAFTQVKTLESLNLLDANISSTELELLSSWPKLGSLGLPNPIDAETVKHLQAHRRLSSLTLGYREISAEELMQLSTWKAIRKLNFLHAKFSDDALQALAKLETVEALELLNCGLTDERLRHLRIAPSVKELSLARNEIDGPGLAHIAHFKLDDLGLEFNNLRDDTLHHLKQLKNIQGLGLSYCLGVTDKGIASGILQEMTHVTDLRFRGLKHLTDASFNDLIKLQHLKHINIRSAGVTWDCVPRLKQAMPNTTVFK